MQLESDIIDIEDTGAFYITGRAPPRNTMVDLNSGNVDVPPNMASWPSFHNGVAAGLKIAPASRVESAWIAYNKPKNTELANEYAGFLMALGLNGHLTKLASLNIHDYLTKVSNILLELCGYISFHFVHIWTNTHS